MSDVVLELKDNGKSCCGCFACFNACPSSAVKMVVGKDGLCKSQVDSLACIDCGLCIKKCPQLNTEHANEVKPRSYAFRADD